MIGRLKDLYVEPADVLARMKEALGQDRPLKGEEISIRGGRTYLVDYIPIEIDGKAYGRLWHHTDISERKQAEQEKENLRAQLLQSQKMETMGTLAGGIAHDFNNMLQVIFSYSDMLLAHMNEGDPGYKGLQSILKTAQDAADLVQKIRIFGRRAEMVLVPLDLNHQIDQVTKLLSSTLPKMIDIEIHLTKDPVIIKADPSQITQMVMNLAVNANEAMPQGGRLSIETENIVLDNDYCRVHLGVKPGPHVMLTVSDTGRGIDKSLMERIFDPFFSTKMRDYHKGTGLGLSVVQGIVQQHGGHITVESEVGKGTFFRMYFPALEHEIVPEYVETKIPYPAGGNETILLVGDMDLVRELGVIILEKFGYTVLSVSDGQEALDVYEKERGNISLVILDIIMPRMDGKECLEALLRINPAVKVIISSGVGQEDLINEVVKIGAKGAVNKPYGMRQLLGMVRHVLDGD
jgi:signal transduction histidine kinase